MTPTTSHHKNNVSQTRCPNTLEHWAILLTDMVFSIGKVHMLWVGGSNTCWVVRASWCLCKVTHCGWGGSRINIPFRGWGLIHLQLAPTIINGGVQTLWGLGEDTFLLDCLALAFTQTCSIVNKVISVIFEECDPWGWLMIPKHLNKLNFTYSHVETREHTDTFEWNLFSKVNLVWITIIVQIRFKILDIYKMPRT